MFTTPGLFAYGPEPPLFALTLMGGLLVLAVLALVLSRFLPQPSQTLRIWLGLIFLVGAIASAVWKAFR